MVLSFDDLRDQLSDVLWYTWDPESLNGDESRRHHYYHLTQAMAEYLVDNHEQSDVRVLIEQMRASRWPDIHKPAEEQATILAIYTLLDQAVIEPD